MGKITQGSKGLPGRREPRLTIDSTPQSTDKRRGLRSRKAKVVRKWGPEEQGKKLGRVKPSLGHRLGVSDNARLEGLGGAC